MTITLPDALKADLERRAKGHGFATVDEYVVFLVEADIVENSPTPQDLGYASQDALEAHLVASLNSGPPVVADEAFWASLRRRSEEAVAARKQDRP